MPVVVSPFYVWSGRVRGKNPTAPPSTVTSALLHFHNRNDTGGPRLTALSLSIANTHWFYSGGIITP
jgi:hypothetical protein